MSCKSSKPSHDGRDDKFSLVIGSALRVPRSQVPELLESVETPLDHVAPCVQPGVTTRRTPTTRPLGRGGGGAIWSARSGLTNRIPRCRIACRVDGCEYALSAITTSRRARGLPGPTRATPIPSSSGSSCGLSPACPGVSTIRTGRPRPSTARWTLVLSPPRDRQPFPDDREGLCFGVTAPFSGCQQHADGPGPRSSPR